MKCIYLKAQGHTVGVLIAATNHTSCWCVGQHCRRLDCSHQPHIVLVCGSALPASSQQPPTALRVGVRVSTAGILCAKFSSAPPRVYLHVVCFPKAKGGGQLHVGRSGSGLGCSRLFWARLGWAGLVWCGLGWAGLGWAWCGVL